MANPEHPKLLKISRLWKNQGTAFKIVRFAREKKKKKKGDQLACFYFLADF